MVYTPVGRLTAADPDGLAPVTVFRHRLAPGVEFIENSAEGVVSAA